MENGSNMATVGALNLKRILFKVVSRECLLWQRIAG